MRSCLLIIYILFSSLASHAQDTSSHHPIAIGSVFWEVSGNGLTSPSYFYGTMHIICERDIVFTDTLKAKMASCKSVYTETVFDVDTVRSLRDKASKGLTLKQIIGRNDFKRVKAFFSENDKMTDSFLNTFSTAKLKYFMIAEKGKCKITSVDEMLRRLAKTNGLPLKGLESMAEHLAAGPAPSISEQAASVFALLNNFDRYMESVRYEMQLYLSGDLEKLYRRSAINPDGSKSVVAINLGEKRSKLWIPTMETAMKEAPCFFAFGCNHLWGENGVINLLRLRGYVVRSLYYY